MQRDEYSLQELAEETGIEIRTIRSWMQADLLPRPETMGRNSTYPPESLTRLQAIKAMRELHKMSLADIRLELTTGSPARIAEFAAQGKAPGQVAAPGSSLSYDPPAGSTAADYLDALKATGKYGKRKEPTVFRKNMSVERMLRLDLPSDIAQSADASEEPGPDMDTLRKMVDPAMLQRQKGGPSQLERVLQRLERMLGGRSSQRRPKTEVRICIEVTRDIELSIRGDLTPEEIIRFERLAGYLKDMLIGGFKNDD